jgi:hypothetical protein
MNLQSGESLESGLLIVREYLDSIEAGDLVDANKIYTCSLYLMGVTAKVNATTSKYTFENFQMDGKSYGDYEMIVRRIEPKEKGIFTKLKKKFKLILSYLNPTLLRKFEITLHKNDEPDKEI